MAIWQYEFLIVPNSILVEEGGIKHFIDEDNFLDDESCWATSPTKIRIFNSVANVLPLCKPWGEQMILFGEEDDHCFEVHYDSNMYVTSVSFRLNHTEDYILVVESVLEVVINNGLVILDDNLEVVHNNMLSVLAVIDGSQKRETYKSLLDKND